MDLDKGTRIFQWGGPFLSSTVTTARKITERLFRDCSSLWNHMEERPKTVSKILYTLNGDISRFLGPMLQPSQNIGKPGTAGIMWGWQGTYIWTALSQPHHFTTSEAMTKKTNLTQLPLIETQVTYKNKLTDFNVLELSLAPWMFLYFLSD